jgi:hypothetical protein
MFRIRFIQLFLVATLSIPAFQAFSIQEIKTPQEYRDLIKVHKRIILEIIPSGSVPKIVDKTRWAFRTLAEKYQENFAFASVNSQDAELIRFIRNESYTEQPMLEFLNGDLSGKLYPLFFLVDGKCTHCLWAVYYPECYAENFYGTLEKFIQDFLNQ